MLKLTAKIEYIVSRAEWKILQVTWNNGQDAPLPKQRYFLAQQDIFAYLQGLYLPESITLQRRDVCQEEQHSLRGTTLLAKSRNGTLVYIQCGCNRFRQVTEDVWLDAQAWAS